MAKRISAKEALEEIINIKNIILKWWNDDNILEMKT